jgi:histidinol phosphatase-like PHP family hydrolase
MIDLHTHTFLSDGCLIASELVRRAVVAGYKIIAITDHVDYSNIDIVLPGIVRAAEELNKHWDIKVIPGVEITHIPLESFPELTSYARNSGAKIILAHGESPVEPVLEGTNRAAVLAGVDILAHPGYIDLETASLAAQKKVYLELTTRRGHSKANKHVFDIARLSGASLVVNTDTHSPEDLLTENKFQEIFKDIDAPEGVSQLIYKNSEDLARKVL